MAFNFPIGYHIKETRSLAGTASGKAAPLLRATKAAGIETEKNGWLGQEELLSSSGEVLRLGRKCLNSFIKILFSVKESKFAYAQA